MCSLSSGDASDSICPKGWGIAEVNGDGGYQKLIANAYGMNKTNNVTIQKYAEYGIKIRPDEIMMQMIVKYFHTGLYRSNGNIGDINAAGYYWTNKPFNTINATQLFLFPTSFNYDARANKGDGHSVRCVAK